MRRVSQATTRLTAVGISFLITLATSAVFVQEAAAQVIGKTN